MTPEENYAEAERLADNVRDVHAKMTEVSSAFLADPLSVHRNEIEQVLLGGREQIVMDINRGMLHAKLAEVGLLFRQAATVSPPVFADALGDTARLHDWSDPNRPFDPARNCQKCGRCWQDQGAECVGGQENSTAKTCLVCIRDAGGKRSV